MERSAEETQVTKRTGRGHPGTARPRPLVRAAWLASLQCRGSQKKPRFLKSEVEIYRSSRRRRQVYKVLPRSSATAGQGRNIPADTQARLRAEGGDRAGVGHARAGRAAAASTPQPGSFQQGGPTPRSIACPSRVARSSFRGPGRRSIPHGHSEPPRSGKGATVERHRPLRVPREAAATSLHSPRRLAPRESRGPA